MAVTNGIGGFASGTISQANTRRYHGLLIASLKPPVDRVVMVAKADVTIGYRGQQFQLGCTNLADGTIAPQGFSALERLSFGRSSPNLDIRLLGCGAGTAHLDGAGPKYDLHELHAYWQPARPSTSN